MFRTPSMILPNIIPLILILLLSCCMQGTFDPKVYSADLIVVGEGGGITGIEKSYYILENGRVYFKTSVDTAFHRLETIDRNIASQSYSNCRKLELADYQYSKPGNIYKFLTWQQDQKQTKIVWSPGDGQINPICIQIHNILNHSLKSK